MPLHEEKKTLDLLVAGGIAGAVAKTVIAPGDRIKILFQTSSRRFAIREIFKLGQEIIRGEGIFALWKGHIACLTRVVPYAAVIYVSFDRYHQILSDALPCSQLSNVIAGSCAGGTATFICYPLDLMRAQAASSTKKFSYIARATKIYQLKGLLGFYKGLSPTLLGILPYAGTSFGIYESLKTDSMGYPTKAALGGLAGLIGQTITYPLDLVRRRMQVAKEMTSVRSEFYSILKSDAALLGCWKAFSMNWIKAPIALGISFTCNDYLKTRFQAYRSSN